MKTYNQGIRSLFHAGVKRVGPILPDCTQNLDRHEPMQETEPKEMLPTRAGTMRLPRQAKQGVQPKAGGNYPNKAKFICKVLWQCQAGTLVCVSDELGEEGIDIETRGAHGAR